MSAPINDTRFFTIIEDSIKIGKSIALTDHSSEVLAMPSYENALDWYIKYHQFAGRGNYPIRLAYQWMLEGFEKEVRAKAFDPDNNQQSVSLYLDELCSFFDESQSLKAHYDRSIKKLSEIDYQLSFRKAVSHISLSVGEKNLYGYWIFKQESRYSPFLNGEYMNGLNPAIEHYLAATEGANSIITIGFNIVKYCLKKGSSHLNNTKNPKRSERSDDTQRKARQAVTLFESQIESIVQQEKGKLRPMKNKEIVKKAVQEYSRISIGQNLGIDPKSLNRYLKDIGKQMTALQYGGQLVGQFRSRK